MSKPRRTGRALLVVPLALVLLAGAAFLVGDPISRRTAQNRVAASLQGKLATAEPPGVEFRGNPFLTQLLADRYQRVDIDAHQVTSTEIPLDRLQLSLTDVAADKSFSSAVAKQATGRATVGWSAVGARAENLPVAFAEPDRVRASYFAKVFGRDVPATVSARPVIDETAQAIVLEDPELNVAGVSLPPDMVKSILATVVRPIPVPLPASLRATGAHATAEGLVIDFSGADVDLTKLR